MTGWRAHDRPAKPPLTREGIITVTLRLLRAEGLERVTMRLLARELDTGPASLYVYIDNMADLHGAVLDRAALRGRPAARGAGAAAGGTGSPSCSSPTPNCCSRIPAWLARS